MSLDKIVVNQDKIMQYIKQDASVSRQLFEAQGNVAVMRDVLKKSATDDFIAGIVDSPQYEIFVNEISQDIIEQHPEVKQEVLDKKLGVKKIKKQPVKKKYVKKYTSKTKGGKIYKKGYKRWTGAEKTFLKSRSNMSASQTVKEYNEFFDISRSRSSITTKIYRLRD